MTQICERCSLKKEFNMVELFSGIGGMHLALLSSGAAKLYSKINITAIDINPNANNVYSINFPETKLITRNITGLKVNDLPASPIDLITMSPPCQPFTRLGLKKDLKDCRSDAFHHLMVNIWPNWINKPKMVLLENVKGFEESKARELLIETLTNYNYEFKEFFLSPNQFGIPNTRLRYYLIAKLKTPNQTTSSFCFSANQTIITDLPAINSAQVCSNCLDILLSDYKDKPELRTINYFLESNNDDDPESKLYQQFSVPSNVVNKYLTAMDIVNKKSRRSCCFTRSYGTLITGTGSILNISRDDDTEIDKKQPNDLKLRYFTPREVANLMCFPKDFKFPDNLSSKQCYKLLGNSINVQVVTFLMKLLLAAN